MKNIISYVCLLYQYVEMIDDKMIQNIEKWIFNLFRLCILYVYNIQQKIKEVNIFGQKSHRV